MYGLKNVLDHRQRIMCMSLCVMSYNILCGVDDRLPLIRDVVKEQNPDVLALVEANSRANAEQLARELDMHLTFGEGNSEFHIAWLSRMPVVQSQVYRPAAMQKLMLEIEIQWQGVPLYLFATHLSAGRDQQGNERRMAEIKAVLYHTAGGGQAQFAGWRFQCHRPVRYCWPRP